MEKDKKNLLIEPYVSPVVASENAKPSSFLTRAIIWGMALFIVLGLINYKYLKLPAHYFLGIFLGIWIAWMACLQLLTRFLDKKAGKGDKNNEFVFPTEVADKMKKLDIGIQYESTILSMAFLLVGMLLFTVYMMFFSGLSWWYRGFYLFNFCCAAVLMTSMLVTQYQQFVAYRESKALIKALSSDNIKTMEVRNE